jgi:hypothetical protein
MSAGAPRWTGRGAPLVAPRRPGNPGAAPFGQTLAESPTSMGNGLAVRAGVNGSTCGSHDEGAAVNSVAPAGNMLVGSCA